MFDHILLPTPDNKDRFLLLIDVLPSLGSLQGFFQIPAIGRSINGFTSNNIDFLLNFLQHVERNIRSVQAQGLQTGLGYNRVAVVILDRSHGGHVLSHDSLPYLVAYAYQEKMALQATKGWTWQARERAANIAQAAAKTRVAAIPFQFRPVKTLLRGENPLVVLRQANVHWWLGGRMGEDTAPSFYSPRLEAFRNFMNDPTVTPALRRAISDGIDETVRLSYERARAARLAEILRETSNNSDPDQPQFSIGQLLAFKNFATQEMDNLASAGERDRLVAEILNLRVNFVSPTDLDAFILSWLRKKVQARNLHDRMLVPSITSHQPIAMGNGATGRRSSYLLWRSQRLNFANNLVRPIDTRNPSGYGVSTTVGPQVTPMH